MNKVDYNTTVGATDLSCCDIDMRAWRIENTRQNDVTLRL